MNTVDQYLFNNKKALIRVDFNVPLNKQFQITDDTRIKAALPTIKKILSDGGAVIIMSHLGRPKSGPEDKFSLKHLLAYLTEALKTNVQFANDCIGKEASEKANNLKPGEVLLLENLRFYKEETKGDEDFSEKLAKLADVYVNDAFGTAHRAHASTAIIAKFFPKDKVFGYVMSNELDNLEKVLLKPRKPFTAIVGGAKVSSKITIIEKLLDKVDHLIIGGGMMFTFIKAMGGKVGNSLVEDDYIELARKIMVLANEKGVGLHIPTDAIVADNFDNDAKRQQCEANLIPDGWMGLDIGEKSIASLSEVVEKSSTILWNGPMGVFEFSNFEKGTKEIALAITRATKSGAYSLIGGGDSVAAINKYELSSEVSYVSTGGGAMLEYIEGKVLPGVAAIKD